MGQKLYLETEDGSIVVKNGRKAWGVDVPAYCYDIWMPVIGLHVIGVWSLLWRLARENTTQIGMAKLARKAHMHKETFEKSVQLLDKLRWINYTPSKRNEYTGVWSTPEFEILDPPTEVPMSVIEELFPGAGEGKCEAIWKPLTWWLVETTQPEGGISEMGYPYQNCDTPGQNSDTPCQDSDTNIDPFIGPSVDPKDKQEIPAGNLPANRGAGDAARKRFEQMKRVRAQAYSTKAETRGENGRSKSGLNDPDLPAICGALYEIEDIRKRGLQITSNQSTELGEEVKIGDAYYPSPDALYKTYPVLMAEYLGTIPALLEHTNRRLTTSEVVRAIRGYHWKRGFFEFLAEKGKPQPAPVRGTRVEEVRKVESEQQSVADAQQALLRRIRANRNAK